MWKQDNHGSKLTDLSEVKCYYSGSHTWAMKLSQLNKGTSLVHIITYSLPDVEYCCRLLGKNASRVSLLCSDKFTTQALILKQHLPEMNLYVHPRVHAKLCLIAPDTVYVGSANFGISKWHEVNVGLRSKQAHDDYMINSWKPLVLEARPILLNNPAAPLQKLTTTPVVLDGCEVDMLDFL
jgi:PLD-like domain